MSSEDRVTELGVAPSPASEDVADYSAIRACAKRALNGSSRLPPRLVPETFRTSRLLDFATKRELTAQIGHPPGMWPQVVVKELVDNALDAAEQAEVAPQVEVTVTGNTIEVRDNGPGLSGDVIDDILDFSIRVVEPRGLCRPDPRRPG